MEYNILSYGAVADGKTNCAAALQAAIDTASSAGGGRVVVPAGRFLSGSVLLKSNVELHLCAGAVLLSSLDPSEILPFPHSDDANTPHGAEGGFFLGAQHEKNIAITGRGIIDGRGPEVFTDLDIDNGFHECPKSIASFRPRLTLFEDVEGFTVQDITLKDAAFWTLHMAGCRHVRINNIQILNDERGANNDGIAPDCCQDVIINGCIIKAGDDAIVIKSTAPMASRYGACENIVVSNCVLHTHSTALKVGTETFGTIRNVTFSDCIVKDCSRAVGIWVRDGGTLEHIHTHHITGSVRRYADCYAVPDAPGWWGKGEPVFVSATPRSINSDSTGTIRDISFDHLYLTAESCVFLAGEPESELQNLCISDLHLTLMQQGTQPGGIFDEQPSVRSLYPHNIPALYARNVDGLNIRNSAVRFIGQNEAWSGQITELESCKRTEIHFTTED